MTFEDDGLESCDMREREKWNQRGKHMKLREGKDFSEIEIKRNYRGRKMQEGISEEWMISEASDCFKIVHIFGLYLNHLGFYIDFLYYICMVLYYKKQKYLKETEQTSLVFNSDRKQRTKAKLIPFVTI